MADKTPDEQLEQARAAENENYEQAKKDIPRHDRAAKIADAFKGATPGARQGWSVMGRRNTNVVRSRPVKCDTCGGSGTVPVDPNDRRKGEKSCGKCGGTGEM